MESGRLDTGSLQKWESQEEDYVVLKGKYARRSSAARWCDLDADGESERQQPET